MKAAKNLLGSIFTSLILSVLAFSSTYGQTFQNVYASNLVTQSGTNRWLLAPGANDGRLYIAPIINNVTNWDKEVRFYNNGNVTFKKNVGIGTDDPKARLAVNGTFRCTEARVMTILYGA